MKGGCFALLIPMILILGSAPTQAQSSASSQWNPLRTSDSRPDIEGYWSGTAGIAAAYDIQDGIPPGENVVSAELPNQGQKGQASPHVIIDPKDGKIPYQRWAAVVAEENKKNSLHPTRLEQIDSLTRCFQMGIPRMNFLLGFQILEPVGYVVMVAGNGSSRTIPLDGRPHIGANIKLWAGDSVGHWEGNTLVVDVTNINEHGWYDWAGDFHSSDLHLVERWTFTNADTIEYEVTSYDPKVFTKPWTLKNAFIRSKKNDSDAEQWEDACYEGERDVNAILQRNAQDEK